VTYKDANNMHNCWTPPNKYGPTLIKFVLEKNNKWL
jgi:hypothetical protein